jgi:hypothetical protein
VSAASTNGHRETFGDIARRTDDLDGLSRAEQIAEWRERTLSVLRGARAAEIQELVQAARQHAFEHREQG